MIPVLQMQERGQCALHNSSFSECKANSKDRRTVHLRLRHSGTRNARILVLAQNSKRNTAVLASRLVCRLERTLRATDRSRERADERGLICASVAGLAP